MLDARTEFTGKMALKNRNKGSRGKRAASAVKAELRLRTNTIPNQVPIYGEALV